MDRADLFKISKLVYGARVIVTSLYGSLQGQREFMVDGLGELFGTIDVVGRDNFGHLKSCQKGFHFSHTHQDNRYDALWSLSRVRQWK